jgi:hypothetical protein
MPVVVGDIGGESRLLTMMALNMALISSSDESNLSSLLWAEAAVSPECEDERDTFDFADFDICDSTEFVPDGRLS